MLPSLSIMRYCYAWVMRPPTRPLHSRLSDANTQVSLLLTSSPAGTSSNTLTQPLREEGPLSHCKRLLKGKTVSRELSALALQDCIRGFAYGAVCCVKNSNFLTLKKNLLSVKTCLPNFWSAVLGFLDNQAVWEFFCVFSQNFLVYGVGCLGGNSGSLDSHKIRM